MTSSHFADSPDFPERKQQHIARHMGHKAELSDAREITALQHKIRLIIERAGALCMLDNRAVFHSSVHRGDEVSMASEIVERTPKYPGYLRIVTNRYIRTDYEEDNGFMIASDSLIGLSAVTGNINTRLGVIAMEGADAVEPDETDITPPFITKDDDFEYIIHEFDTTPIVPYPTRATIMRDSPEDIARSASYADHVLGALDKFTLGTENTRYPFDS